jgi:hypothetical protein
MIAFLSVRALSDGSKCLFTGNCDFNAMTELRNLRGRINELETDLRDRDEEVKLLKEQQLKHSMNGTQEDSETIRVNLLNPSPIISIKWN